MTQFILQIWPWDQSLVTLTFSYHNLNFIRIWPGKTIFFESCSWFKFNNLGLALSMALKVYTSVAKGLKLLGEGIGAFCSLRSWIVNNFYFPPEFHSHSVKSTGLDKKDRILSSILSSNKIINLFEWVETESCFINKNF